MYKLRLTAAFSLRQRLCSDIVSGRSFVCRRTRSRRHARRHYQTCQRADVIGLKYNQSGFVTARQLLPVAISVASLIRRFLGAVFLEIVAVYSFTQEVLGIT